jgi:glycosyltransferase involved in cell wall biosynthesis
MKIHANVPFKNEALLLKHLVPVWNTYPVDEWVFFDDGSTDDSVEIVNSLDAKVTFVSDSNCFAIDGNWHETNVRQKMFQYSKDSGAEFIIAIDADEFLSSNMIKHLEEILKYARSYQLDLYWYNFVEDIYHVRQDDQYLNNYKNFIMHVPSTYGFQGNLIKHTPRAAPSSMTQALKTKEFGLMHLQSMNVEFYALKQLWYKHWEYHVEKRPVQFINARYDPVVSNLNFNPVEINKELVKGVSIESKIFKELIDIKGYKEYILNNLVPELVTFGKEYVND